MTISVFRIVKFEVEANLNLVKLTVNTMNTEHGRNMKNLKTFTYILVPTYLKPVEIGAPERIKCMIHGIVD